MKLLSGPLSSSDILLIANDNQYLYKVMDYPFICRDLAYHFIYMCVYMHISGGI